MCKHNDSKQRCLIRNMDLFDLGIDELLTGHIHVCIRKLQIVQTKVLVEILVFATLQLYYVSFDCINYTKLPERPSILCAPVCVCVIKNNVLCVFHGTLICVL